MNPVSQASLGIDVAKAQFDAAVLEVLCEGVEHVL